ncbi:MAG: hypothetical protein Q7K45_05815 [Nanoarchaeota archaeon]|nr:hypothetical protein [Nanoarchaeota archaeon]
MDYHTELLTSLDDLCQLAGVPDKVPLVRTHTALTSPFLIRQVHELYEEAKHEIQTEHITTRSLKQSLECISSQLGYVDNLLLSADLESRRKAATRSDQTMAIAGSKATLMIEAAYHLQDKSIAFLFQKTIESIPSDIYPRAVPVLNECLRRTPAVSKAIVQLVQEGGKNGKYLSEVYFLSHLLSLKLSEEIQLAVYEQAHRITTEGHSLKSLTSKVSRLIQDYGDRPERILDELKKYK